MARPKTKKRAVKRSPSRKKRLSFAYPLVIFLLLCVGVFLVNSTFMAGAQDIKISAAIQGPPVTEPAIITSPADRAHFSAVPIEVAGNCSAYAAYVEIFRNNVMSGSAICDSNRKFQLQMDLFPGKNDISARSFNINDNEGPGSAIVWAYYDVPVLPSGSSQATKPLIVNTPFIYKGYYVGQEVRWPLSISGGTEPYALNVDWGDGSNSIISRKDSGQFDITHTYKVAGADKGSFTIKVQASDSDSNYTYLEFFVIVNPSTAATGTGTIYTKPPPTLGGLRQWLWLAWPAYATVFLMVLTYKLGEREELIILRKRHLLKR